MVLSAIHKGWARVVDSTGSELGATSQGQFRFQLGSASLANEGANTVALLHGMGTSATPVETASGSVNFMGYWLRTSSTSGDVRGMYTRLFFTGPGGTGEAHRIYATISDVAVSTVRGAHISLSFAATGTATGVATALECTLHLPTSAGAGGTLSALQVTIDSATNSDPQGNLLSFIRFANQGSAQDDVDDDAFFFEIVGVTSGATKMWYDNTSNAADEFLKVKTPSGTRYLILSDGTTFS